MKATIVAAALLSLFSVAFARASVAERRQSSGYQSVSVGLKSINLENNAQQQEFSITPGFIESEASLGLITGVELLSVTNNLDGVAITLRNITCRMFEDQFGATPMGAAFGGFAGAATSVAGPATVDEGQVSAGFVMCVINDGSGDCTF